MHGVREEEYIPGLKILLDPVVAQESRVFVDPGGISLSPIPGDKSFVMQNRQMYLCLKSP